MDVKETKEVLNFAVSLAVAIDEALIDGYSWTDLVALVPPLTKFPAALDGIEKVLDELKDLDQAERAELAAEVEKLELNSELSEKIAEQAVIVATEIGKMVLLVRDAKKVD